MLKFKRKLLAAILAVSIVLSSGVVLAENETTTTTGAENAPTESGDGDNSGEPDEEPAVPVTEDEALSQMSEIAKSDSYTLYFNKTTCIFAVKNNKSGYIWWSTPYDYLTDEIAGKIQKDMMASMISYKPLDVENNTLVNTTTLSYEASVRKEKFELQDIENGVKIIYEFTKHHFKIPVSISLENDRLKVQVHTSEINEKTSKSKSAKEYKLANINLCQSFGAGRADEEGYIFVPDGSGAVINFNNGKTSTTVYQSKVYGEDSAVSKLTAPSKTEQTYFPVLGIVKNIDGHNEGMLAVVDKGDPYAIVSASVSGQAATNINSGWFNFEMRASDTFTMGTKTPLTVFQADSIRVDDIVVYYYFLTGDEVNIGDLAETYRNYLINEKGLTQQSTDKASALAVTTMGGTITKKSVLGMPVDMQTVATSYSDAQEIMKKLKDLGVDNMQLIYNEFTNSDMKGEVTVGADYSNKLGGKNEFAALYDYTKNNNISFYPGVNFMEYTKSGNGYSFTLNSSKRVTKAYATQNDFDLAFGNPDTEVKPTWTILSPYYWPDVFNKITNSFKAEGISSITLNQATSLLYSDFSRVNSAGKPQFVRQDSIKILTDGYKQLNDAGISIIAQGCNAYALPYVKAITNVPLYSSNYDLFDYDVPFYQMVIHGYIPYSSKPVNASSDSDELRLLSLLTGSAIHYELMHNSPNDFLDSKYDKYFYSNYAGWLEFAANDYKMFKDTVSSLADKTIVKYTVNGKKNFTAEYSDGTKLTVDTDKKTFAVNGQEKSLAEYGLKGVSEQ